MSDEGFVVAGPEEVGRLLDRMAASIHARLGTALTLVGIRRRGVPLAEELAVRLGELGGEEVPREEVALKRYADDLTLLHEEPELKEAPRLDVEGRSVVLVDDVLYSGRTLLSAVRLAVDAGAERVHAAVLCSRGPDEVPVHAAWTGLQMDIGDDNLIEVHAPPYEDRLKVMLEHRPGG